MADAIFKLVYFLELVLISVIQSTATRKFRGLSTAEDHSSRLDLSLLVLSSLGMIVPLFYIFSSALDFADYHLPVWMGWLGTVFFAGAAMLLWKTHRDLGRNWTPTLAFRESHTLVTAGIYRFIRHPMSAAHLLWAIAQPLMLQNWIAGFSFLVVTLPQYLLRVDDEEEMMLKKFGEDYKKYTKQTGRLFPKLF
ncbi:MAG: isoprenylcysteine carboxylmethyltransferase family protein [Anaerolineales bacterium]|nr:MAG: isoprenylcysteine carboxylmethyltransferase family protein [Anaerolineales bacterium]